MSMFRKKPVVVHAYRMISPNPESPPHWLLNAITAGTVRTVSSSSFPTTVAEIATLEGLMLVNDGDWIIQGVKNELYPCKPDIFDATYDKVAA